MADKVERARAIQDGEAARALLLEWEKEGGLFPPEDGIDGLPEEECLKIVQAWVRTCDHQIQVRSITVGLKELIPGEAWDEATEALVQAVAGELAHLGTPEQQLVQEVLDVATMDLDGVQTWIANLPEDRRATFRSAARGVLDPTTLAVVPGRFLGISQRLRGVKGQVIASLG